jgi:NADPH:quinone reductase-like Zn-dependent oxidoreductase
MRAIGVMEFGGPDSLQVVDLPERHAGPGQVRVRVHAAAVNPTDTLHASGARAEQLRASGPPPYVPGMDVAGVVDEVGEGVDALSVSDAVMAIVVPEGSHGGYSSSLVLPAESVVPVPAGASFAEAATVPMNALTARMTLDLLALPAGASLAVTGAAGAYGGVTVQLAKTEGLFVIADASEADEEIVRGLGADVVVRRGDDVAERIREVVPAGVDAIADGSIQNELLLPAVRDGGGFATLRAWPGPAERDITIHTVRVREYARNREALDRIRQLVEAGKVTMRLAATYPAEQAGDAHRRLAAGGTRGRLVLEL